MNARNRLMSRTRVSLLGVLLSCGAVASLAAAASAGPDDSVWYQRPGVSQQPVQNHNHHVSTRSHSSRSSGVHFFSGHRYGYSSSRYSCPTYGRYGNYGYSAHRTYRSSSYYPRYSSYGYTYSRPTVISYPSTSTRITYVTPPVTQTQYSTSTASGAYDAVSYREYQRLLAEQRVLRQQVIELEKDKAAAEAPTYNPGPAVPSNAPLNQVKGHGDDQVKPDRPRSADEILPPVPNERSVRAEGGESTVNALPEAWRQLANGNFPSAMNGFTLLAGEQEASTADRIGFALSAAAMGQREKAAWAMRRVLIADADGFGFMPASDELRTTLKRLSSDIGRDAEARAEGPDRRMLMFLAASIDYLALDMDSGLERLDQAKVDGEDHHEGAVQLRRLLTESGASGF